jgi:hypothetical protein
MTTATGNPISPAMNPTTPFALNTYVQIGKVIWRSLGITQARWLYVALACLFTLMTVGGGISLKWGLATLLETAVNACVLGLQITWVFVSATLIRLNTPTATCTVPHYAQRLRRTALALWLGICIITGLLEGKSMSGAIFLGFSSGVWMLLIITPWRWPVQWCIFMALLVFAGSRSNEIIESAFVKALFGSPALGWALAITCYLGMAWLVTRLIAANGSRFSAVFSRSLQIQNAAPGAETPVKVTTHAVSPVAKGLQLGWQWLLFPWRLYLRHTLDLPLPAPQHASRAPQALSRSLLGLGTSVHWLMQVCAMLTLWTVVLLVVVIVPMINGSGAASISGGWAVLIALGSLMAAVTPVLSLPETLRQTAPEQKLMLLLPGMPRGQVLNRMLAVRHLRHAFIAWLLAALSVVALPYPNKDVLFVGSFYLGAFVLLPIVITDWARIQPPNVMSALLGLLLLLVAPAIGLGAVHWLHTPNEVVALAAVVYCGIMLAVRWRRLPLFAPAFPAGRLGRRETERDV